MSSEVKLYRCPCGREEYTEEELEALKENANCHKYCKIRDCYEKRSDYEIIYPAQSTVLLDKLLYSVIRNTSLRYVCGYNAGISDRYECSQCGADKRCRDIKGDATLKDVEHKEDCAYIIARKLT